MLLGIMYYRTGYVKLEEEQESQGHGRSSPEKALSKEPKLYLAAVDSMQEERILLHGNIKTRQLPLCIWCS
jgi:hypothetical protein